MSPITDETSERRKVWGWLRRYRVREADREVLISSKTDLERESSDDMGASAREDQRLEDVQESPQDDDDTGCTRCDAPLVYLGVKKFHEGDSVFGVLLGPMREFAENRQRIEMWACYECGHVEFFMPLPKKRRAHND